MKKSEEKGKKEKKGEKKIVQLILHNL